MRHHVQTDAIHACLFSRRAASGLRFLPSAVATSNSVRNKRGRRRPSCQRPQECAEREQRGIVSAVNLLADSWRAIPIAAGLGLVYLAVLTHQSEKDLVQDRLETLWIRIDDLARAGLSKHVAFVRVVSQTFASGLDAIFGRKLFSIRFLVVSVLSSLTMLMSVDWARCRYDAYDAQESLVRLYGFSYDAIEQPTRGLVFKYQRDGMASLWGTSHMALALAGAALGFTLKRRRLKGLVVLSFVTYGVWVVAALRTHLFNPYSEPPNEIIYDGQRFMSHQWHPLYPSLRAESAAVAATILATILCDLLCIGVIRRLLRRAEGLETSVLMFVATCFAGAAVFGGPVLWYLSKPVADREVLPRLIAESNVLDATACALLAILALAMLAHRAAWPLINRSLLALASERVVLKHRGWVFTAGLALIGIGIPGALAKLKAYLP